jgi:hypothetical protein
MKVTLALALVTVPLIACKSATPKEPALMVVYDGWWSNDYAANSTEMQCSPEQRKYCRDDARAAEVDFTGKFSAAFQADPSCSGIQLIMYNGPDRTSAQATDSYSKVLKKPHWVLQVNFDPKLQKEPWQLSVEPGTGHYSTGEGDAPSVVHSVCSIVKNTGGSVVD